MVSSLFVEEVMMSRAKLTLELSETERVTLETMRDRHPRPYLRERAAALLRIADGMAAFQVAAKGLKVRDPDTIYGWLHAYQTNGICGFYHRPRRRRISPQCA